MMQGFQNSQTGAVQVTLGAIGKWVVGIIATLCTALLIGGGAAFLDMRTQIELLVEAHQRFDAYIVRHEVLHRAMGDIADVKRRLDRIEERMDDYDKRLRSVGG